MTKPHVCPKCNGEKNPNGCHPCNGTGIVWEPGVDLLDFFPKVPVQPPVSPPYVPNPLPEIFPWVPFINPEIQITWSDGTGGRGTTDYESASRSICLLATPAHIFPKHSHL